MLLSSKGLLGAAQQEGRQKETEEADTVTNEMETRPERKEKADTMTNDNLLHAPALDCVGVL